MAKTIAKLYHLNPNDYGDEYFVLAESKEKALEYITNSKEYGSELFKGKDINNLPDKYTLNEYELGKVIRSEIA